MKYSWYDMELCKRMHGKFITDHPEKNMDLLCDMATNGSIDDFRIICNCLYVNQYSSNSFYGMNYEDSQMLRNLCNERIHTMLGDRDALYNELFRVWHSERWGGDETWRMFCDACKPFEESSAMISIVEMGEYLNQKLTLDNLPKIAELYYHRDESDLLYENIYGVDLDIPSEFRKANKRRQEHVHRWRKFMAYIWVGDFDSGRSMIYRYKEEKEAQLTKIREQNSNK